MTGTKRKLYVKVETYSKILLSPAPMLHVEFGSSFAIWPWIKYRGVIQFSVSSTRNVLADCSKLKWSFSDYSLCISSIFEKISGFFDQETVFL
jgi:hypothetical protein